MDLNATTYGINTFGVSHKCRSVTHVNSVLALQELLKKSYDPLIVGGGSNLLFTADQDRDILVMDNGGIEIVSADETGVVASFGAGTNWHESVMWAIENNYGGIENLSLIPGKCGAAPMQNIGAYGVELEQVFDSLEALNRQTLRIRRFDKVECSFGYRDSIFKKELKDQFIITKLNLRLTKAPFHQLNMDYGAIKDRLSEQGVNHPSIQNISETIIGIRQSKLPDPKVLPNSGSFFKNPIISDSEFRRVQSKFEYVPSYPADNGVKVPAGWLIEQCGWKGKQIGKVATHSSQALVIVNHGTENGRDIFEYSKMVQAAVQEKFGVLLEREVNVF